VNPPGHKQVQSNGVAGESKSKDESLSDMSIKGSTTIPSAGESNGRVCRFQKEKADNNNNEQLIATEGKTSPVSPESALEPAGV